MGGIQDSNLVLQRPTTDPGAGSRFPLNNVEIRMNGKGCAPDHCSCSMKFVSSDRNKHSLLYMSFEIDRNMI